MKRVAGAVFVSLALHALTFFVVLPTLEAPGPGRPSGNDTLQLWLLPGASERRPPEYENTGPGGSGPPGGFPAQGLDFAAARAVSPAGGLEQAADPADDTVAGAPEAGTEADAEAPARGLPAAPIAAAPAKMDPVQGSREHSETGGARWGTLPAGGAPEVGSNRLAEEYPGRDGVVTPAVPLQPIAPNYPEAARRRGEEGKVRLRLEVDASGQIVSVSVEESSGVSVLDSAATQAAQRASFRPARLHGAPVRSSVGVTVVFELDTDAEGNGQ